jgi:hypothetical protein
LPALAFAAACLAGGPVCAQRLPPGADGCVAAVGQRAAQASAAESPVLLGDVCADLADALEAGVWGQALAFVEARSLSADRFLALVELAQRYEGDAAAGAPISVTELADVVAGLRPFEPLPELSLWERIIEWLQGKLGEGTGGASDRFLEWLRGLDLPESWVRPIAYAAALVIVATVVAIAVNELRHGGAFAGGARRRRSVVGEVDESMPQRALTFDDLHTFPPREQPIVLFRLVVECLQARNARSAIESLTHRELVAANVVLGSEHASALDNVARAAERVTFGAWVPAPQELDPILDDGRTLLSGLGGAPGA